MSMNIFTIKIFKLHVYITLLKFSCDILLYYPFHLYVQFYHNWQHLIINTLLLSWLIRYLSKLFFKYLIIIPNHYFHFYYNTVFVQPYTFWFFGVCVNIKITKDMNRLFLKINQTRGNSNLDMSERFILSHTCLRMKNDTLTVKKTERNITQINKTIARPGL